MFHEIELFLCVCVRVQTRSSLKVNSNLRKSLGGKMLSWCLRNRWDPVCPVHCCSHVSRSQQLVHLVHLFASLAEMRCVAAATARVACVGFADFSVCRSFWKRIILKRADWFLLRLHDVSVTPVFLGDVVLFAMLMWWRWNRRGPAVRGAPACPGRGKP